MKLVNKKELEYHVVLYEVDKVDDVCKGFKIKPTYLSKSEAIQSAKNLVEDNHHIVSGDVVEIVRIETVICTFDNPVIVEGP
jgi:hypothetical protein